MKGIVATVALCLMAAQAHAGWQYTHWGMTLDEVMAAAGPAAKRGSIPSRDGETFQTLAFAPYETLGMPFTAFFEFSKTNGRLIGVHIEPTSSTLCSTLYPQLERSYGRTSRGEVNNYKSTTVWFDTDRANLVIYTRFVDEKRAIPCSVHYGELAVPGKSGL